MNNIRYAGRVAHHAEDVGDEARPSLAAVVHIINPAETTIGLAPLPETEIDQGYFPPYDSYHLAMMLDAGHLPAATSAMLRGQVAPPAHLAIAVAVVKFQREKGMSGWAGFKSKASLLLTGENPNGLDAEEAEEYLGDTRVAASDLVKAARAAMGAEFVPSVLRIDFQYCTEKPNGTFPIDECVSVTSGAGAAAVVRRIQVPIIFQCRRFTVGTQQRLREAAEEYIELLKAHIDNLPNRVDSNRTLSLLVGATVWASPTTALVYGHGSHSSSGLALNDPAAKDNRCIARAILMGLDPMVRARTDTTLWWVREQQVEGAMADRNSAAKRVLAEGAKGWDAVSPSVIQREAEAMAALDTAQTAFAAASAMAARQGVRLKTVAMSKNTLEEYRTRAAYPRVKAALASAVAGVHVSADFRSPFFATSQRIDAESVAFIRSCVPSVALQFWSDNPQGGAALNYPDPRAHFDFLAAGGTVLNLLCRDGHVSVITSLSSLCYSVHATNLRALCPLCGVTFAHKDGKAVVSQKSALAAHIIAGCPRSSGVSVTHPLTPRNLRQLGVRESRARWQPPLTGYVNVALDGTTVALVLSVLTPAGRTLLPCPWNDSSAASDWHDFYERFSEVDAVTRHGDSDYMKSKVPLESRGAAWVAPLDDLFVELASNRTSAYLLRVASSHLPRLTESVDTDLCYFCRFPLASESRWRIQSHKAAAITPLTTLAASAASFKALRTGPDGDDEVKSNSESDDDDAISGLSRVTLSAKTMSQFGEPATGRQHTVHTDCCCAAVARGKGSATQVTVEVPSTSALQVLLAAACSPRAVEATGSLPVVHKGRDGLRDFVVTLTTHEDHMLSTKLRLVFRGPSAFLDELALRPSKEDTEDSLPPTFFEAAQEKAAASLIGWADQQFALYGLWPLFFASDIAYTRARLLDSIPYTDPIPTSFVSRDSVDFYERMTKGGRMVTGCRVVTPPTPPSPDSSILYLDVRSMYPAVLRDELLPCQEHTDRVLQDWSTNLAGGLAWVDGYDTEDATLPVAAVEVWGAFPPEKHAELRQLPPVYSRVSVKPSDLTPFQRLRMGVSLCSSPQSRVVSHFLPLEGLPVFLRELQLWLRLGFVVSRLGVARGTHGARWGRSFATECEVARRQAETSGDLTTVAAVKRAGNSVIGAINLNVSKYTTLKGVLSEGLNTSAALETGGDTGTGTKRRGGPEGRRAYRVRMADDPCFTGRVYECGSGTFIERSVPGWVHTQQTAAAMAVQAYARCRHAEMFYGRAPRTGVPATKGIRDVFPDAKVLYGNTDSLVVEVALTPALREAGYKDVRLAAFLELKEVSDFSGADASLLESATAAQRSAISEANTARGGSWGLFKEETGWIGLAAVVVNGPNRWGYREAREVHGSPPRDVMKSLPKCWLGTSLEQYAASWAGGHSSEELAALEVTAREARVSDVGTRVPWNGTCVWGNAACVVSATGNQWPFGTVSEDVAAAYEDTDV